jgi:hypothetical protein
MKNQYIEVAPASLARGTRIFASARTLAGHAGFTRLVALLHLFY